MTTYAEQSDARFCAWMEANQARAAELFGVYVTGPGRWGWRLRSLSAPARRGGEQLWLRVGTEQESALPGEYWDGLPSANKIDGIRKPVVLDSAEWPATGTRRPRRMRADLMTYLAGEPCSPDEPLCAELEVPERWWSELRRALDTLRTVDTDREVHRWSVSTTMRATYGDTIADQLAPTEWSTIHGDLHWNNLLQPELGVLDWEMWGSGPAGTDAANLYCTALLAPDTAHRVWTLFEDQLTTPAGRKALFRVAARQHSRAPRNFPDLAEPLQRLLGQLLDDHGSVTQP